MTSVFVTFLLTLRSLARSRAALHLEVLALRHQLPVGHVRFQVDQIVTGLQSTQVLESFFAALGVHADAFQIGR